MPKFSKSSQEKLDTCDFRLKFVLEQAIKIEDFSVVCGHRTPKEQFELYKKGRYRLRSGEYKVQNKEEIVTNCDGHDKLSNHNYFHSKAVDIIPYPTKYSDIEKFHYLAGIILSISHYWNLPIGWGGNWKSFKDLPHFEITK